MRGSKATTSVEKCSLANSTVVEGNHEGKVGQYPLIERGDGPTPHEDRPPSWVVEHLECRHQHSFASRNAHSDGTYSGRSTSTSTSYSSAIISKAGSKFQRYSCMYATVSDNGMTGFPSTHS